MQSIFLEALKDNTLAGAPITQIISHDTLRIHAECIKLARDPDVRRQLLFWNRVQGLCTYIDGEFDTLNTSMTSLAQVIDWYQTGEVDEFAEFDSDYSPENSILLLEDVHYELGASNPELFTKLRLFALRKSQGGYPSQSLIFSQPVPELPVELEKDTQILHLPLPGRNELKELLSATQQHFNIDHRDYDQSPRLIDAALGLSTAEAQLAFAKAAVTKRRLTELEVDLIVSEKEQVIKKSGLLEYFHPQVGLDDVGGLQNLKEWLERRKNAYSEHAREFGLEYPKGLLMLGLPGTGKSLSAKAISANWQLPLLRLDMGKVFGGIVGQSEENIRKALQTAEAIAPCILWVDEIEKGLSGMQGSGSSDGGTTARVLGTFLTWMQEKNSPVFVLATANHIEMLPPELLRKGRVDEIFFVDLPTQQERIEILTIHLKKRDDRHEHFSQSDLEFLAKLSRGFTGAELEEVVKEALFMAFNNNREIKRQDLEEAIDKTSPLSITMHETIQDTREWVSGRAVPASRIKAESLKGNTDNKRPRLQQEMKNPFIK